MFNSTTVDILQKLRTEGEYQKALMRREEADTIIANLKRRDVLDGLLYHNSQSQKQAMSMSDHAETVIDRVSRKAIHLGKKKEEIKAESIYYFMSDLIKKEQW